MPRFRGRTIKAPRARDSRVRYSRYVKATYFRTLSAQPNDESQDCSMNPLGVGLVTVHAGAMLRLITPQRIRTLRKAFCVTESRVHEQREH